MPPARSATSRSRPRAAASAPRRLSGPRRLVGRAPRGRVRWDRIGRVALLLVLAVVAGLYVQHALAYVSARSQYNHQRALLNSLQRDNARLLHQERALKDPATIVQDARRLGMVRPGERSYVMPGGPSQ